MAKRARRRKKRRRRMPAAERRRQLLESSAVVFAERGYHGATTAELARAAGITEPILYRHFENKLDLFVNLIDEVGEEVIAAWRNALGNAATPEERFEVILRGNPSIHETGRDVYQIIFRAMTEADQDPAIHRALRRHIRKLQRFLKLELAKLQREGVLRSDVSAETVSFLFIDIAIGFGMLSPLQVPRHSTAPGRQALHDVLSELILE